MAFDPNLISFAPREGVFQLHLYKTTGDSLQTVASATATSYFGNYAPQMAAGDFVLAEGSDGRGLFQITAKTTADAITLTPVGAAMRMPHSDDANNKFVFYATTADTLKTIASATATTYFATYGSLLNSGDVIYARGSDGQGEFRVTSSDASTAPTLAPIGAVYALPTASTTANVVPYGVLRSTSTAATYTLDMPWGPGQVKHIYVDNSTAVTVLMASTAAGSINSTGVQILFNEANQSAMLVGVSTAKWFLAAHGVHSGTSIVGPVVS